MTTIVNGFQNLSDANLETKTQYIITKMTDNPHFPTPVPTLQAIEDALTAFTAAAMAAKTGDKVAILDRDQKKETVANLLHEETLYVMYVAKGDKVVLASSGFDLSKDPEPAPPIGKPTGLVVSTDGLNTGKAFLQVKRVKGAKAYLYEYNASEELAESGWSAVNNTRSKALVSGLESGKRYWFRVTAMGSGNQAMTSDVVSRMID